MDGRGSDRQTDTAQTFSTHYKVGNDTISSWPWAHCGCELYNSMYSISLGSRENTLNKHTDKNTYTGGGKIEQKVVVDLPSGESLSSGDTLMSFFFLLLTSLC